MKGLRNSIPAFMIIILGIFQYSTVHGLSNEDNGYRHLNEFMDKYHRTFYVYDDRDSGGNHFFPAGWMGRRADVTTFDSAWTQNTFEGVSCIKITYSPSSGTSWAGVYWQTPEGNWGTVPDAGYDLTGATVLTFWARGQLGGEAVEFFAFGVGRNLAGNPISPYPDSSPKVSLGYVTLSAEWQEYTIDLTGVDLSYTIGGFGWVTNWGHNPSGATFYLDQIGYDLSRLDEPRFLRSYETIQLADPDFVLTNAAYAYDNAMAVLAYIARGTDDDLRRARLILDAFIIAQENDRYYTDGRLRSAYMCGDLLGQDGYARLPGWWDDEAEEWYEDQTQVSSNTGNIAWVMIAFLRYCQDVELDPDYLTAAETLGEWVFSETYDPVGIGGYTAGYEGWEPNPTKLTHKSSEHSIDLYSAFVNLYRITDESKWLERAQHALNFLEVMWNDVEGHFWIGTKPDGQTIWNDNLEIQPMDTNTWGFMALGRPDVYGRGIDWVEQYCSSICSGFDGFDYNYDNDRSAVWFEGTAQMVVAYKLLEEEAGADHYLIELQRVQTEGPNNNGKGIISACPDGLDTYLGWKFFSRLHVGATSWYLLAERGYNPLLASNSITLDLFQEWSLISCPGDPVISDFATLFQQPIADGIMNPDVFAWNRDTQGFEIVSICEFGRGYWVQTLQNFSVEMEYHPRCSMICPLKPDWELMGSVDGIVSWDSRICNPPEVVNPGLFGWDGSTQSFVIAANVEPGKGYYVNQIAESTLTIDCAAVPAAPGKQIHSVSAPSWEGVVSLNTRNHHQELTFGMHPSASPGFDILLDSLRPPVPGRMDDVSRAAWVVDDPNFSFLHKSFVGDSDHAVWELSVEISESGVLQWDGLPDDYCCLVWRDGEATRIYNGSSISLSSGRHDLRVVLDAFASLPEKTELLANYPNPFNPETWIPYHLAEETDVIIRIYDATGKLTRVLNLGHKNAGFYTDREKAAYWDGRNEVGESVTSGVYFYSLQAGGVFQTGKLAVIR